MVLPSSHQETSGATSLLSPERGCFLKKIFLNDVEWIDQLKLRAAFGLAGNNRIDNDMWRYLYSVNSTGGPGFGESTQFGEQWYGNQGNTTFANKDIKWETT